MFLVRTGRTLSASKFQEEGVTQERVLRVSLFAVAINDILDAVSVS